METAIHPLARTLRFDLAKTSQEAVIALTEGLVEKGILYYEEGDKTGKPHLQGWCQFKSPAALKNFQNNRLKEFRAAVGYKPAEASCALVKKGSYFVYITKDKRCVWSVGVTDDERIAWEDKSFKKGGSIIDIVVSRLANEEEMPSKVKIAREVVNIYRDLGRPVYMPTAKAQVLAIMLKLDKTDLSRDYIAELLI